MRKNNLYTKRALSLSLLLLMIWSVLGAGTTVAWFTDTTVAHKNTFYVGDLDLKVSYFDREINDYVEVDENTKLFNESALYEPAYVQVVYLKIENVGDIEFDYTTSVMVTDYTTAVNKFGQTFNLVRYLSYGVVFDESEDVLRSKLSTRSQALEYAKSPLNTYTSGVDTLGVGEDKYMALIVTMPTWVGNEANHSGIAPTVKLGISVKASQSGTLEY